MIGKDITPTGCERFSRAVRLGANRNYRYVYRRGRSHPSRAITLVYLKGKSVKVGFSVSSKVGNAVTRNRIRRYMKEDVRRLIPRLKRGKYIFIAKPCTAEMPHAEISLELMSVLNKALLIREENK